MDNKDLDIIAKKLKKSPMFQLSLSSKELFHSNFLYWIWNINQEAFKSIVEELYNGGQDGADKLDLPLGYDVKREVKNFDLSVWSEKENGSLLMVIENKVKSIPRIEQLDRYKTRSNGDGTVKYLLLSLSHHFPEKEAIKDNEWRIANYFALANAIKEAFKSTNISNTSYEFNLTSDYCAYIHELDKIVSEWDSEWNDCGSLFWSKIFDVNPYDELRIADLREKYFVAQALNCFLERVPEDTNIKWEKPIEDILADIEESEDTLYVNFGMTRSNGFFEIKVKMDKGTIFLIQVQGKQYRRAIERLSLDGNAYEWLQNHGDNLKKFFAFDEESMPELEYSNVLGDKSPFRKNQKEYNGFCKFGKTFVYQYVEINDVSIKDLIDAIVSDINEALNIKGSKLRLKLSK